jgi:hypothetical protein
MPGARSKKVVQDGDTLLVDKSKIPAKYLEVPAKEINKLLTKPREKKPLSEKQQANLQRLIELNKKRREEKLAQMKVNVDDLGEIPEDKVVVKAVRKVGRPRKNPSGRAQANQPKQDEEHEVVELPPKQPVLQREKKQVPHRPLSPSPSRSGNRVAEPETEPYGSSASEEEEKEEKEPAKNSSSRAQAKPRRKIEKAGKIVDKKRSVVRSSSSRPSGRKPRYVSETSETETQADDEDSDDSDYEEERVKKYVAKTKARMEALKQIESQLKPQSKYAGMSIF